MILKKRFIADIPVDLLMIIDTKSPDQSGAHTLTKTKHELFIILTVPSLVPIVKSSIAPSAVAAVKTPMA